MTWRKGPTSGPSTLCGDDRELDGGEINRFVGGKMFLVKFGRGSRDPIWPVDIFVPQSSQAQEIFGFLLADAIDGFPVPLYPGGAMAEGSRKRCPCPV